MVWGAVLWDVHTPHRAPPKASLPLLSVPEQCLTSTASQPLEALSPSPSHEKPAGMGRGEVERASEGRRTEILLSLSATVSALHVCLTQSFEEQVGNANLKEFKNLQHSCTAGGCLLRAHSSTCSHPCGSSLREGKTEKHLWGHPVHEVEDGMEFLCWESLTRGRNTA